MKKSYISIFLLFIVMILAISAVNAAEIDETSDSDALAIEETTVGEVVSTDAVDDIQTAAEQTEVLADPEDGNNFTSLQYKINNSQTNFTIINKNYLRVEGDNVIEINRDFTLKSEGGNIIDANNLGGIFKIKEGVTFVLQGITLVNGISDNGGAIYNEGHLTLNNSVFKDNVATIDGGAIYNSGTLEVDGCTFANNTANNNGGAIYTDGGQITLTHSVLDNNDVINLESSSSLDMGGAAIYAKNAQVTLTNTNVTNNGRTELDRTKGDMINGVLNLLNSTVTIAGGLFENNTGIYGGAILANGDGSQVLSINGATFRNNKAYNGGAIDIDKMTTTISDCTFENNWVVGPGSSDRYGVGGAVAVSGNAAFRLTDSNFTGNKATGVNATGGAVHIGVDNDPADIQNCVFTDNTAEYKGDAIYNHGPLTLSGNTVNSDVPGIYTVSKINTTVYVIVNDNQNGSANYYETIPVVVKITDDNGNIMTIDEDTITLDIGNSNNRETLTRDDVTGFFVNNELMVKQSGWLTPSRNTIRKYFPNYPASPQGTQYLKNGYITMNKVNVTLSVNYENITYLDDVDITVNLTGPANAPKILVFNTTTTSNPFTLTVNDVVYKVRINGGIGTLTIPGLPVGEYVINASWAGNPNYNPIEKLYDLKVSPVPGTFTDLQSLINNAQNNVLDLPYNFTYNKDIDGDVFKQGVVINDYIVINGNGYTISGNDSARIFNITGNDITLNNMTLTNGKSNDGGAIYANGYDLKINNVIFKDNYADLASAIQFMHGYDLSITDCEFTDNHAEDSGTVSFNGHSLEITRTTFENNFVDYGAAAVRFFSDPGDAANVGMLTVTDSQFIDNKAGYYGAIEFDAGLACNIVNTNFTDNKAFDPDYGAAGAIYFNDGGYYLNIKDSKFIRNHASVVYGAIYFGGIKLEIEESDFINNTAELAHGAIFVTKSQYDDTDVIIKNSEFKGNEPRAIYLKDVTAEISNTDFIANKAAKGAAIYADNSNVTIDGGNFLDNNATQNATIFSNGYDLTVSKAFFKGNKAADMTSAIQFIEGHDLKITDCAFLENNAGDSGTVSFNGHNLDIVHTIFHNNTVTKGAAAVRFFSDPTGDAGSLTVTNCSFTNNKADYYGAIEFDAGIACNIVDTYFVGNKAINPVEGASAAINFLEGGYYLNIKNSHFINNDAAYYGAIFFEGIKLEIEESEFINNTAGIAYGAIFVMSGQYATGEAIIKNSKFENNKQGTTPNSIVVFNANLYLEGNTINTDYAEIINAGNITSEVTVVLLNNQTVYETESYNLTAVLYDDQGNLIKDSGLKLVVNDDEELDPVYDAATGVYVYESYAIGDESAYVVSASSPREANLVIKTGTILNEKVNLTKFEVQAPDIVSGDDAVIFIDVYGLNDTGLNTTVTVVVNNTEYSVNITDGQGNLTVPGLENGIYPVLVHYPGTSSYNAAYASCVLKVLTGTNLTIAVDGPVDAYSEFYVHLELLDSDGNGVTGYVVLTLTGQDEEAVEYNVFLNEGYADFLILTVSPGVHGLQAAYAGDDTYIGNTSDVINFTVKEYTDLVVEVQDPEFVSDVTVIVSNITAANGNLTVTINGKEYEVIAVNDNTVSVTLKAEDIIAGENTLKVEYSGDERYSSDFTETTFTTYGNVVTNDTFFIYFDEDGLKETVPFEELIFEGEFAGLGVTDVIINKPISITGDEATLTNIGFKVFADNVSLDSMTLVADTSIGDLIGIYANNATVSNMDISYTVNEQASAITVYDADHVVIKNNDIVFESEVTSDDTDAMAINVHDSSNVVISNNRIHANLSAVSSNSAIYNEYGAMGLNNVHTIKIYSSNKVKLNENEITGDINARVGYPTLDNILVLYSNDVEITGNNITIIDEVTPKGEVTYIYGLNIILVDELKISKNNIVISTDSGADGSGSAYPIQIATANATISENNLSSISNGPNIGVYVSSVTNYFYDWYTYDMWENDYFTDDYYVSIERNTINVTGYAATAGSTSQNYYLVSGIEVTAGDTSISDNTIYVYNKAGYVENAYVFGISHAQPMGIDASLIVENNKIYSADSDYTVGITVFTCINEANITDNYLIAHERMGDDAVYALSEDAIIKDNLPEKLDIFNFTTPENSTSIVISVNLPENATGYILLEVNGTQTFVPLENGKANVTVPNLAEGTYNATVTYTGDANYSPITTTKEINVTSNVPDDALNIPDSAKSDAPTTYSISLPSDATGYLEVDVDGTKYVAALNNGSASVTIPALSEGNHNVTVSYSGDSKYSPVVKTTKLAVAAPVFNLSENKNINVVYSAKATYKVLVTKDGKAVGAGESVTIKFNGKTYTAKTDAKGYATLKLNTKVKVKKYTVTATYKGITVKNTVKVTHVIKAGNKKAKKSKAFKLKVKTKKVNGKYLKGKKLKLKFKGKTYKAKISKKGVAKFTIKKNVMKKLKKGKKYKYTVIYGKDKVTKKIKIK